MTGASISCSFLQLVSKEIVYQSCDYSFICVWSVHAVVFGSVHNYLHKGVLFCAAVT